MIGVHHIIPAVLCISLIYTVYHKVIMSHPNYKTKKISRVFVKPNSISLRIIAIFLSILFITLYAQYNSKVPFFARVHGEPTTGSSLIDSLYVKAADSISANSNHKYIPFTSNTTLPPRIVMVYDGIQHRGVLVSYKYRHGYTFGQLDIPAEKVTALLPSDVVNIKKGSIVRFFAKGDPAILPSNSLSISAYTNQGKAVGVLNTTKAASSTFSLNLQEGKYILLAVATWLPGSEDVTGYAIFSYMVNVVP